jgi:hypothetical protein
MDHINIGLTWECPCDNRERLVVNAMIPTNTPYPLAVLMFRALWDEFNREKAGHGDPQKS